MSLAVASMPSTQAESRLVRRSSPRNAVAGALSALTIQAGVRRRSAVSSVLLVSDLISAVAAVSAVGGLFGFVAARAALASLPLLIVSYWVCGLYDGCGPTPFERLRYRIFGIVASATAFLIVYGKVLGPGPWLLAASLVALLLLFGFYGEVLARAALIRNGLWGAATAFVGRSPAIGEAWQLLASMPQLGLRPVGRLEARGISGPALRNKRALGHVDNLAQIRDQEIEFVVVANKADFARTALAAEQMVSPPRVILLKRKPGPARWPQITPLDAGVIRLAVGRDLNAPQNRLIKRAVDLSIAVPAALLALPLIGLLALAIKFVDPGPSFYTQTRVGLNKRSFRVIKMRSMFRDAESRLESHLSSNTAARVEWDHFCKLSHDPRLLPYVGAFIRRTSIDELPQLWHVIRGDMSLVGPRPFPAYHVERFGREFQAIRASTLPGLTGLWQVSSRSNGDLDIQASQDLYYIRNWSIWFDFYILLQTIPAVAGARGAR